jgi:subtilisin family serine protease
MTFRFRTILLLALLVALLTGALTGGYTQSASPEDALPVQAYQAGELLVKFAPFSILGEGQESGRGVLERSDAEWIETLGPGQTEVWQVPEGRELELAALLSTWPGVEYAEPNYEVRIHFVPNDTYYAQQWAHPRINSPAAWALGAGGANIIIAILDTGVDLNHPEFQGRLVPGFSAFEGSPHDDHGHGTHVAGIAAATGNNGMGVAGMAWQAKIMPVKVLDASGKGTHSGIARSMDWAVDQGARIINLSLGGVNSSATLSGAIQRAHSRGVLIVASAGNCGGTNHIDNGCAIRNQTVYPAAYDQTLAVAATTASDTIAAFSNQGAYVGVAAPGSGILSTRRSAGYGEGSGTSQAAPFVSGLAALVWSLDPSLTAGQVEQIIKSTAVDRGPVGFDIAFGHGRIDAWAAVANTQLQAPTLSEVYNPNREAQYTLSWSVVPQATGYTLEEDDNAAFNTPRILYSGAASQATLSGRETGTWYYRVRSTQVSSGRMSAWSNSVSVRVGLDAPYLLPIENAGQKDYRVNWEQVTGATGYRLQESAYPDFAGAGTRTTANTYYDITAQPGSTWYYRVQAHTGNQAVASPWSTIRSVQVVPASPAWITLTEVEADAYTLSWPPVAGATGYRLVEREGTSSTSITRYVGAATSYPVTGQPSGRWTYTVHAFNLAGDGPSSASREITVTMPDLPKPAMAPIANADKDAAYVVQWSGSQNATRYTLEESRTPWFETPVAIDMGMATEYVVIDQPIGRWFYRVRTHFGADRSPWSASVAVLVPAEIYFPLISR